MQIIQAYCLLPAVCLLIMKCNDAYRHKFIKIIFFAFLLFAPIFDSIAQDKSEQILSIALTLPETTDIGSGYDHAFRLAASAGMMTPGEITFYWDEVEHKNILGKISYSMPFLDLLQKYFKEFGMRPVITICPFETLNTRIPKDLRGLPMDSPQVIERFSGLIHWVYKETKDMDPLVIVIGNEFDLALGHDSKRWAQFKNLYINSVKVIHSLPGWEKIPVALEPTFPNLVGPDKKVLKEMNAYSDIIGVSYYPVTNDKVDDFDVISRNFDILESIYPNKPIDFYQYGYPSSKYLGSSEEKQREFIEFSFDEWDKRKDKIRIITFTWLYDIDMSLLVSEAVRTTGLGPDKTFTEFLASLGMLRRKPNDEKPAFKELMKQVEKRGWIRN